MADFQLMTEQQIDKEPNSTFVESPTDELIEDGPSAGDGCWRGCLASPHSKNWFLSLGLWTLVTVQFICLAQLDALCSCYCHYWDESFVL